MSRTFKDRPSWVVNHAHGRIDHDHTRGECRVQTLADAARPRLRHHVTRCRKYVWVEFTCTKADPYRSRAGWRDSGPAGCWTAWPEEAYDGDGRTVERVWRSRGCAGHVRREYRADRVCVCDDLEPQPTCTPAWEFGRHFYRGRQAPKWFRDQVWHNPERRRERDELRAAARSWNAGEDLDGYDFENRQARNAATWLWL